MSINEPGENEDPAESPKNKIHKYLFHFSFVIGKGGFGKVWKVEYLKTKQIYALKEMAKLKIIDKNSEKSINAERKFLTVLNHPFIVNMHYAFQDNDNLYLVLDYLSGGDLRYHVSLYRRFSEEQTRFFIASIIHALDYIHNNQVIHRDIKPENLVLDDKGYLRITDFGIAKENSQDNSNETSGTPGYMAPEVMQGKNHSNVVDFFAIGVIGYEFMKGKRPYFGQNKKEIKDQMLSTQVQIEPENKQFGWSPESVDFINQLLQRKPKKRLGYEKGTKDLMEHPWLKYYPWKQLSKKTLLSPFMPEKKDNFDKTYCESIERLTDGTKNRYADIIKNSKLDQKSFINYYYNIEDNKQEAKVIKMYRDISFNSIHLNNKQHNHYIKSNLLQSFLPISINKKERSKLVISNKNGLNNSRNFNENNNSNRNINKSRNTPCVNQIPLNQSKQSITNKALSCRIPSNDNLTNDINNDSFNKNEIHGLIQKRRVQYGNSNSNNVDNKRLNNSNSIHQYNNIIINKILNNKNHSSSQLNKQLIRGYPYKNNKANLLKNHSRSSSLLIQNNDSWRNTSLYAQIEYLSQHPNDSTKDIKSGLINNASKFNLSKSNIFNCASKRNNRLYNYNHNNNSYLRYNYDSILSKAKLK